MSSASSSRLRALVHSFLSFNSIVISHASIGIGSVGISEAPIFPITSFTSGNFFISKSEACVILSIVWLRELPVSNLVSTAKSPSSNVGINSPPNVLKIIRLMINRPTAILTTSNFIFKAPFIRGV